MRKLRIIALGSFFLAIFGVALLAWNMAHAQQAGAPGSPVPGQQGIQVPPPKEVIDEAQLLTTVRLSVGPASAMAQQRPNFTINPETPLADLLPPPPKTAKSITQRFSADDLTEVREVTFQEPLSRELDTSKASFAIGFQLAKIRHLNQPKTDAFLEKLIGHRSDLQGMPFAMGDACRIHGERAIYLAAVSALMHRCIGQAREGKASPAAINAETFWTAVTDTLQSSEKELAKSHVRLDQEAFDSARVAAAMQILAPESAQVRLGLVKYLARISHVDATKALAKLALFSGEEEIHLAAIAALRVRREKDYSPILMDGLRYPLTAIAKRAADAVVRLECTDLVPQLVELLDEPDPRLPVVREVNGSKVRVVRELVRVNHHRNCMLCHSPAAPDANVVLERMGLNNIVFAAEQATGGAPSAMVPPPPPKMGDVRKESIEIKGEITTGLIAIAPGPALDLQIPPTAPVPLPTEPLGSVSGGYGSGSPDIMVRIDVTYLRQDFSLMQPVHDAAPWPEMQRFDYMVRTRALGDKEAAEFQKQSAKAQAGSTTPYQRAILFALRELTGRDTGPTRQAWRELLTVPAKVPGH